MLKNGLQRCDKISDAKKILLRLGNATVTGRSHDGYAIVTGRSRFGHATVTVTVQKRTEYCTILIEMFIFV